MTNCVHIIDTFVSIIDISYLNLVGFNIISCSWTICNFRCIYKIFRDKAENLGKLVCVLFSYLHIWYFSSIKRKFVCYRYNFCFEISYQFLYVLIYFYLPIKRHLKISQYNYHILCINFYMCHSYILGLNILNLPLRPSLVGLFGAQVPFVALLA